MKDNPAPRRPPSVARAADKALSVIRDNAFEVCRSPPRLSTFTSHHATNSVCSLISRSTAIHNSSHFVRFRPRLSDSDPDCRVPWDRFNPDPWVRKSSLQRTSHPPVVHVHSSGRSVSRQMAGLNGGPCDGQAQVWRQNILTKQELSLLSDFVVALRVMRG
jgi:hypothetical protein